MAVIAAGSSSLLGSDRTAAWTLAVLGPLLPGLSPGALELVHTAARKLGHVVEFGILAVLWRRALQPSKGALVRAFVATAAYGVVDELRQGLAPTRSPSAMDVLIDMAGALLGLAAWEGYGRLVRLLLRATSAVLGVAAGLGVAFLALDRALGRRAWDLAGGTLVLALAAWGAARAARAWRGRL
jgi:VanZ family protein